MTDERNENEIAGLRSLPHETRTTAAMEERVVRELHTQGLLKPQANARASAIRWVAGVAACVVFFAAGWFARESGISASPSVVRPAVAAGPRYLLLLRSGSMPESSPKVEAERVREYTAWGGELRAKGQFLSAAKLDDAAQVLTATSTTAATLSADPKGASNGSVQGFFLITAPTLDEALQIARACPHLRHGGVIELRPLATT